MGIIVTVLNAVADHYKEETARLLKEAEARERNRRWRPFYIFLLLLLPGIFGGTYAAMFELKYAPMGVVIAYLVSALMFGSAWLFTKIGL